MESFSVKLLARRLYKKTPAAAARINTALMAPNIHRRLPSAGCLVVVSDTGVCSAALEAATACTGVDSSGAPASAKTLPPLSDFLEVDAGGSATAITGRLASVSRFNRCSSARSEEHTSELQSQSNLVCRLLLE